ncbi:MAG: cation:proton antiporter [Peptococcaceae bacterium]|nr:cation:proton antiporter [Peptococcaceae bacterium]
MHLPHLISDLALILLVAGIVTIFFKKLKQPLVLGYIVAGLLTGPYLSSILEDALSGINLVVSIPTVVDMENIHVWSEIGIIFLMFALGLEFSFHKLANVGQTAIILAITEVCGMLVIGFSVGTLMGWGTTNSLILGAVLSMSSTTIIIKAFEELNLKGKQFTELVFGGLIVEDIAGIFIMVFLSTFALSQGAGVGVIAFTIVKLMVYLVLWLLLGIFLIPTLLKKAQKLMNDETLLIVSLGLCLGMVLLFVQIGFSSALGAFIAGSILAGTIHATRIEHLTKPVKDFFGAVFFISVGMMVDPAVIIQYAGPILLLSLATIVGKLMFSSLGVLFAGNRLHTAVFCGASLAQIGEFSFIIALLAINLGLGNDFLYPVIVSVSVITTFTTPFCIKNAEKLYGLVKKTLPNKLLDRLDTYTSDTQVEQEKDSHWKTFLRTYFIGILIYSVLIIGIMQLGKLFISPLVHRFINGFGADLMCTVIPLLLMAPFIISMLRQRNNDLRLLMLRNRVNRLPMFAFLSMRVTLAVFLVMYTINLFMGISMGWLVVPAVIIIALLSRFDAIFGRYLHIEARFLANFNEKLLSDWAAESQDGSTICTRVSDELWVGQYRLEGSFELFRETGGGIESASGDTTGTSGMSDVADIPNRQLKRLQRAGKRVAQHRKRHPLGTEAGTRLSDLVVMMMDKLYYINIIKIISGKKHINMPDNTPKSSQKLHMGDTLFLLGIRKHIDNFNESARYHPYLTEQAPPIPLLSFIQKQDQDQKEQQLLCFAFSIDKTSVFSGKSIKDSGIRKKWNCVVIGIQRGLYPMVYPDVQTILSNGDKVWLLGSQKTFGKMVLAGLIEADLETMDVDGYESDSP